jgi:hypothetical protein
VAVEPEYKWRESDVRAMLNHVRAMHGAMCSASDQLVALIDEMQSDSTWSGQHKVELLAWLDLVRQYVAKLADEGIGGDAATGLSTFLTSLSGYDTSSDVYTSLRGIG